MDITRGQFAYVEGVLRRTLKTGEATAYNTYNVYRLIGVSDYDAYHTQLRGELTFFLDGGKVCKTEYERAINIVSIFDTHPVAVTAVSMRRLPAVFGSPDLAYSGASKAFSVLQRMFYENKGVVLGFSVGSGRRSFNVASTGVSLEDVEKMRPSTRKLFYLRWLISQGFDMSGSRKVLPPSFPTFIEVRDMAAKDFVNRLNMLERTLTKENL